MLQVIGYRNYEFTSPDGALIKGVSYHAVEEIVSEDGKGAGFSTTKFSLSNQVLSKNGIKNPADLLNQYVNIYYNQYKKVEKVDVVENHSKTA